MRALHRQFYIWYLVGTREGGNVSEVFAIYFSMSTSTRSILFEEICSEDFLKFSFGGRGYQVFLFFML